MESSFPNCSQIEQLLNQLINFVTSDLKIDQKL